MLYFGRIFDLLAKCTFTPNDTHVGLQCTDAGILDTHVGLQTIQS